MNTKIVIYGNPGEAINGNNVLLEVGGVIVDGQISLKINAGISDTSTATIELMLPEVEYRDKSLRQNIEFRDKES